MVDIAPLLALGQGLAAEAIRTSGTTVRVESRVTVTDPGTLEKTVTATVVAAAAPGIVVPATRSATQAGTQPLPGVELRWSDWKVILLPDHPVPTEGLWLVVEACADPTLRGAAAKVLGHATSSAGAVLTVYARPVTS